MIIPALPALLAIWLAASQPSIDCETVRSNYAQWKWVGRPAIRGYLRVNGYSKEDIREAEKCLK